MKKDAIILDLKKILKEENDNFILIKKLFQDLEKLDPPTNMRRIKKLLKKVICMGKTTGANGLYEELLKSSLPFSEELLTYAVDHEPYYNNNDIAFVCCLVKISTGTKLENPIKDFLFKTNLSKGHRWSYKEIFKLADELRDDSICPCVNKKVKQTVIHSVKNSNFDQSRKKAIAISLFLGIDEIVPFLSKLFESEKKKVIAESKKHESGQYVIVSVDTIIEIAIALYCLTKKEEYLDFLSIPERNCFSEKDREHIFLKIVQIIQKTH